MVKVDESGRIEGAADQLTTARRTSVRLRSLGDHAPRDVADAHKMADLHATQLGHSTIGWKVGSTSTKAMQMLNSPGPFAGRIFEGSVVESGSSGFTDLVSPSVECEFAFFLGADLPARRDQYSVADVQAATARVAPAIEIVDSRFVNMGGVGYLSLIADSGANAGAVIGEALPRDDLPDLKDVAVQCSVDGVEVSHGSGADILGDPWLALEWLANHLAARGLGLRSGQLVLSGTCTEIAPLATGQTAVGDFGDFGTVAITRDG